MMVILPGRDQHSETVDTSAMLAFGAPETGRATGEEPGHREEWAVHLWRLA